MAEKNSEPSTTSSPAPTLSLRARIRISIARSLLRFATRFALRLAPELKADPMIAFCWECKDYADGWIRYFDEHEALAYQRDTGCALRVTYRPAPAQPDNAKE